jgi:hypothetical protein
MTGDAYPKGQLATTLSQTSDARQWEASSLGFLANAKGDGTKD